MAMTSFPFATRTAALALIASLSLVACGTSPAPGSVTPVAPQAADLSAASLAPATELRILAGAKFKDGGAGLKFVAVRGGKEIDRTLEFHPAAGGKWTAKLNGHVVNQQYFQGREGRMLTDELSTLTKAKPEQFAAPGRQVQALPALVVAVGGVAVVSYAADLGVRTGIYLVASFGLDLIRAITGHDPEGAPTLKWTFLLPFNWGYANWTR